MLAPPFGIVGQLGHFEKTELSHRKVLILLGMGQLGEYMTYSLLQKFLAEQEGRLKALIKAHGDAA